MDICKKYCDEEIYLRLMTVEDTDMIVAWRNKEFVKNNFIYRGEFTAEGHLNWIKTQVETGRVVQFIICLKENDRPVGSVYFRDIDKTHNHAEYGIFIGEEDAISKGIGTRAAKLACRYAFEEMKLHKIILRLLAENERARKSYENAGFTVEGEMKDYVFLDGRYRDVIFMGMLESAH